MRKIIYSWMGIKRFVYLKQIRSVCSRIYIYVINNIYRCWNNWTEIIWWFWHVGLIIITTEASYSLKTPVFSSSMSLSPLVVLAGHNQHLGHNQEWRLLSTPNKFMYMLQKIITTEQNSLEFLSNMQIKLNLYFLCCNKEQLPTFLKIVYSTLDYLVKSMGIYCR